MNRKVDIILKKTTKYLILTITLIFVLMFAFDSFIVDNASTKNLINEYKSEIEYIPYSQFVDYIEKGKTNTIYFSKNTEVFYIEDNNSVHKIINPEYDTFKKDMLEKSIEIKEVSEIDNRIAEIHAKEIRIKHYIAYATCIAFLVLICICFTRYLKYKKKDIQQHRDRVEAFVSSMGQVFEEKAKPQQTQVPVTKRQKFEDVAGLHEVKKDVQCLVDFLKNKDKYIAAGAKLPKGVIFYGPPGTGKTLLAKAIAGEAGIPFHYMSGSDFVEMYVGVGAKRVRELFAEAKKKTPCIIFIDEIDAIGGKRSHEDSNGEDKKTLNALLTEMDGFKSSESIIVIGATNRIEALDPALLRPGRFSNKYCIPLPCSAKERREVIDIYIQNKKFAEDVDFDALAKETIGFSPAAIESLLNEAAIISVQDKKRFIDKEVLDKAMIKILLSGHIKENQEDRNKEELRTVAWHEAGHALVGKLNGKEIPKVTILSSTSGAGGVTFTTPKEETGLYSVDDLKDEVKELYAGRIAEMLMDNSTSVTTGASNDIEKATNIIKSIVTSYGMTEEFGLLNLNQLKVSQDVIIDKEVKLAKEIEKDTIVLMKDNFESLQRIANALIENETLYDSDLTRLMSNDANEVTLISEESKEVKEFETTEVISE